MLDVVAKESPDPSTKVGCLLTDEVGRVVIAGYNHMPIGCEHFSWSNDPNGRIKIIFRIIFLLSIIDFFYTKLN